LSLNPNGTCLFLYVSTFDVTQSLFISLQKQITFISDEINT
jgi:hypothetical protein